MKNWILKIHLYGGLLCFWYLIIFGTSSLFYQHHFEFMKNKNESKGTSSVNLSLPAAESDSAIAAHLTKELDIAGWYLFWETKRDSLNNFHTRIENPKMSYTIDYNLGTGAAIVGKSYKGIWSIVNALHGFAGRMPNAPLMIFWTWYTYVCVFVVLFSIISGIWLFAVSKSEKRTGWISIASMLAVSIFFMMYIYFNG